MKTKQEKEWYSPWPDDIGDVVREDVSSDQRHKVFVFKSKNGLYLTYLYEFTDSDIAEGRSDSVGWFRVEGPSTTDSLVTANEIATETLKRINRME